MRNGNNVQKQQAVDEQKVEEHNLTEEEIQAKEEKQRKYQDNVALLTQKFQSKDEEKTPVL